ncbi:MAG: hypothetical protein K1X79_00890 [Oligoflexia bacterium]|nr:hypothetical protein [Oligoflexia bacterium]
MTQELHQHIAECHRLLRTQGLSDRSVLRTYAPPSPIPEGPLSGLCFVVKDTIEIKGASISLGIAPSPCQPASSSAAIVSALEDLGACCLGSTNLDELCATYWGTNRHFGDMRNPISPHRSALGSSTGSAICVTQAYVDFALGTDFGGSVRAPAAACGIVGLKLQRKSAPDSGIFFLSPSMDGLGILCRNIAQIQIIIAALGLPASQQGLPLRIFVPHETELINLAPEYRSHFDSICETLSKRHSLATLAPTYARALEIRKILATRDMDAALSTLQLEMNDLPEAAKAVRKRATLQSSAEVLAAENNRLTLMAEVNSLLTDQAALLTPTLPLNPPLLAERDKKITPLNFYLALANVCDLSAISWPCPSRKLDGIPFSLHCMAQTPQALCTIASTINADIAQ